MMTMTGSVFAILAIGIGGLVESAYPQVPGSSDLRAQLIQAYPVTVLAENGIGVIAPGTVFVMQRDGVQASSKRLRPFQNNYENGKVTPKGLFNVIPTDLVQAQPLTVQAKVYLLKIDVGDDSVTMTVQTCGDCDSGAVDPMLQPRWASIHIKFVKGFLTATDLKHVEAAIGTLLTPEAGRPAVSAATRLSPPPYVRDPEDPGRPTLFRTAQRQPTVHDQRPGEDLEDKPMPVLIVPPPPEVHDLAATQREKVELKGQASLEARTAQRPELGLGWQRDKVNSMLGLPDRTEKHQDDSETCFYGDTAITFSKKGLVTAIVSTK
jgi:hypothetical protein